MKSGLDLSKTRTDPQLLSSVRSRAGISVVSIASQLEDAAAWVTIEVAF